MFRLLAIIMVCKICIAILFFTSLPAVAGGEEVVGTPLPDVCLGRRGDRTVSRDCPDQDTDDRVIRFFFHKTKHCKKFSLCPSTATHLDEQEQDPPTINYFQDLAQCEDACTNVVECSREPLLIAHGQPGTETEEGEWREVEEDQRLGFDTTVTFRCDRGYGLPEGVWNRTCQLNGTWSGATPSCNIQCPRPELTGYTVSSRRYYEVGDQLRVQCMDGHEGNTSWTCLSNGSWTGVFPECSRSCTPPLVDNADPPVIKAEGLTIKYTYTCNAGYTLLNVSNENSTLSSNNYTLSCVNGQLQGEVPVCTRVEIRSQPNNLPLTPDPESGVYHYQMEGGSRGKVLTCGLEGVDQQQYPAQWILPKISNGEEPPAVETNGNILTFDEAFVEQNGTYICNICNINASVIVRVTPQAQGLIPPTIVYFYQISSGVQVGGTAILQTFITGTVPFTLVWQHNSSNLTNNSRQRMELNDDVQNMVIGKLTISDFREDDQGSYRVIARNNLGSAVSPTVTLTLDLQNRGKRSSQLCQEEPGKVVLSGVVRRLGRKKEGLPTMTLRVKTVLRGEGDGIESGDKLEVRILSGNDTTKRLHRGKSVILSGVPVMGSQQRIIYVMDTPILDYSAQTERAINDC